MKLSILCIASVLSAAFGLPNPQPAEDIKLEKRAATFAITGGAADGSGVQPRLEIRTLAQNADQWNLFLLTLQRFQAMDQSQLISYYQIAGIHGVPNVPWDGATQAANTNGAIGYCTHSTQLFATWHRPYTALFEQSFLAQAKLVVSSFPSAQQARWEAARKNMRFPYWDWAATPPSGGQLLPAIITNKYVTVTSPSGQQSIINPLFRFDTHPLDHNGFIYDPFDNWPVTLRYPNSTDPVYVYSVEQNATNTFQNNAQNIQSSIYQMFTQCQNYATFSTDQASQSNPACSTSLEAIHGGIHNDMGGGQGHMTYIPFSAFDPSFWLHHFNVDRMFALWQAMYPNSYIQSSKTSGSTYAIAAGTTVDGNFPLQPFHSDTKGTAFTSNNIRTWTNFKYTYPEFVGNSGDSATIRAKVNQLYGGGSSTKRKLAALRERRSLHKRDVVAGSDIPSDLAGLLTPTGRMKDWTANIVTPRFALGDSYNVYVFLNEDSPVNSTAQNAGKPAVAIGTDPNGGTSSPSDATDCTSSGIPTNPACYPYAPTLVGSYGIFAATGMQQMSGMPDNLLVASSVHLTTSLVSLIGDQQLASLKNKDVVPFLKKNLAWRVRKADGTDVNPANVPGFRITVATADVTPAKSVADFPTWGKWTEIDSITQGQPGGA